MAFDKRQSAGYLANHMARLFATRLHQRIKPLGLAPAQFMTLLALWDEDGQTQKQLVEKLNVEQATMANTLARMERDGLVQRRPHPADARAQQVWLTNRARSLEEPATSAASAVNTDASSGLSREDWSRFLGLMREVIDTLQNETGRNDA